MKLENELTGSEIGCAIHYETPIHLQPYYSNEEYTLPNSEQFAKEILSLPSYPSLTNDQIHLICEHVNKVIR